METMLATLNRALRHARSSLLYQNHLPDAPLEFVEEWRQLPFTSREDLREHSPFGRLSVPLEEAIQYHESSGTTGAPVSTWFTRRDVDEITGELGKWGVRFGKGDRVLIRFPYALSTISHLVHAAVQRNGACVIPADSRTTVTPLPRVVRLMRDLDVTVLACLSLQAVILAETAEMLGFHPRKDFPHLRAICTAGEPLTPARRRLLEEAWGVPVYDNYGMTETGPLAIDCPHGYMHVLDGLVHLELLKMDGRTEAEPGEVGRLIVTTLTERATPVIRYQTGDLARIVNAHCPCGEKYALEVMGRESEAIWIDKRPFTHRECEEIVSRLPSRRFWIVGPLQQGGLHFVVEQEEQADCISSHLLDRLEEEFSVRLRIDLVPKGTLYPRDDFLSAGLTNKPRYFYSEEEMAGFQLKPGRST